MTLRIQTMSEQEAVKRAASPEELEKMKALLEEGMQAGALGLSTGLWYPPNKNSPTSTPPPPLEFASRIPILFFFK